jgi:hypothetical protein
VFYDDIKQHEFQSHSFEMVAIIWMKHIVFIDLMIGHQFALAFAVTV